MRIPILSFPWTCYTCNKKMNVTYPTTKDVYRSEFRGNIAPTFSKTLQEDLIGNLCPACGAYQGNNYVLNSVFIEHNHELEKYLIGFIHIAFKCLICGKKVKEDPNEDLISLFFRSNSLSLYLLLFVNS